MGTAITYNGTIQGCHYIIMYVYRFKQNVLYMRLIQYFNHLKRFGGIIL